MTEEQAALKKLVSAVEVTGGIVAFSDGTFGCALDKDWADLADAVIAAHKALESAGVRSKLTITDADPMHDRGYAPTNYFNSDGIVVKRI
jgi:azurin